MEQKRAVLFDLDGTLLPMDNEYFIQVYFKLLCKKMAAYGYDPDRLVQTVWRGTKAMMKNDGKVTNEELFWQIFLEEYGEKGKQDRTIVDGFYTNEFHQAVQATDPNPELAKKAIREAKEHFDYVVLATSPVFPAAGVATRLSWIDLKLSDFDYVTTYENSCYVKPNPAYFQNILQQLDVSAENCLMIGNDVSDDILPALQLGFSVYWLDDYKINKTGQDMDCPHGNYLEMIDFLSTI